jgi:outer membrane receptor protein involved in Fe transport
MMEKILSRSVRLVCAGGFVLGAQMVSAQEVPKVEVAGKVQKVEVTGSRIISANAESPAPIQVLTAKDIEESGVTNIQDLLQKNPVFGPAAISRTNSNFSTSSVGVATVDLRGLGTDRTLVLVNGRRYVPGIPGTSTVDLNTIPTEFIERIEILTGGASATYGSDAVAGVVNIILKKSFEGIAFNAQYGESEKGDSEEKKANITFGTTTADGKGNIIAHFAVTQQGSVFSRDRAASAVDQFSEGAGFTGDPADFFTARRPFFSSFTPAGVFNTGGGSRTFDAQGNLIVPSTNGPAGDGVGATGFNRSAFRTIAVPTDRLLLAAKGDYALSEKQSIYFEGTYAATKTKSELEPFPLSSTNISPATGGLIPGETFVNGVPTRNPLIPTALFNLLTDRDGDGLVDYGFNRRLSDIGNRGNTANRDTFRFAGGFKGELYKTWNYDVSAVYGSTKESQVSNGQVNVLNFNSALHVIPDVDDLNNNGSITDAICADANARAQGCVPLNVFGVGSISPAAAAYVAAPSSRSTKTTEKVVSGAINGELFDLPAGAVSAAVGAEYREESSSTNSDVLTTTGLNGGNAIPDTAGKFNVKEIYAEIRVPLLKNIPFVKSLDSNFAIRQGDYSSVGSVNSWTTGVDWAPVSDLRIRGTASKATRAPNVSELFTAPSQNFPSGLNDPCTGVTATSTTTNSAQCRLDPGVNANIAANGGVFTNNQADLQGISGFNAGNPNLDAEKSKSYTLGFVLTPKSVSWLKNFAFTADYFDIKIKGAIGNPGEQFILDQCYSGTDTRFCNNIIRRQVPTATNSVGSLEFVNQTLTNSGGITTNGVDLTAAYSNRVGSGNLNARVAYTYLHKYDFKPTPDADIDPGAGEIGLAKNKFVFNLGYDIGNFGVRTTTTYIGSSALDDQFLAGYDLAPGSVKVPSKTYLDLQAIYRIGKSAQVYFGIDNATNTKAPPIISGLPGDDTGTETSASTYDVIGRRYYVGLRYAFK